jgi:acetyl esterase/lipase
MSDAEQPGHGVATRPVALTGAVPVLMLLGARDDWTPAAPCEALAARSRAQGHPVKAVTYPDAGHAFDVAHVRGRAHIADARGGRGATVAYDPAAHADTEKQVRAFLAGPLAKPGGASAARVAPRGRARPAGGAAGDDAPPRALPAPPPGTRLAAMTRSAGGPPAGRIGK